MNKKLAQWVNECAEWAKPESIHRCTGSTEEYNKLIEMMLADGTLLELNQESYPGCYLHRSNPNDVARVENLTFICSTEREHAGPTNNWMSPEEGKAKVWPLFENCMKGRTMYVVPYIMGPAESPFSKIGVEITDSPYVVANMRIMTRMGDVATKRLSNGEDFVPGLHSMGDLNPSRRYILHFPDERLIWSFGSGYGGNALLGKKCFALRIASVMGKEEGWMAEHMLILELEDPTGDKTYFAAAFPSACGKTNLAMLISPLHEQGYKVRTVGDDIAWMHVGEDGRLWAINPEAGFFGVAPGTSERTNPNALAAMHSNSIFTNVAVTEDGIPWWEGKDASPPANLTDWMGEFPWTGPGPAAHSNSRFTTPASQCPSISPSWESPQGVPISGIIFGGRRDTTVPLVAQAFDWQHGTFLGATMTSKTTAAATAAVGQLRYDPMAMLPFCGYHMGDYFQHWLEMGKKLANPPQIFYVNWFRQNSEGKYLWPGYGQNIRALIWMLERVRGTASAVTTPIGLVPDPSSLNLDGLKIDSADLEGVLKVDSAEWRADLDHMNTFLTSIGDRLPQELWGEFELLRERLAD
ncbi:MAG: phosphoenolpyruvate carboxykinase (GTP) [Chthonomonadales bacterium]